MKKKLEVVNEVIDTVTIIFSINAFAVLTEVIRNKKITRCSSQATLRENQIFTKLFVSSMSVQVLNISCQINRKKKRKEESFP